MPEMAYIRDCHNRLEYVNPAIAHQLRRDATGELCHRAIYRRDQPCPWCPCAHSIPDDSKCCETTPTLDGRTFHIACTPILHANRPASHLLIMRDITARQQAEQALQESEARYKRLVASVTDYIYSVKIKEGKVVSTIHGEGCIAVTGYSTADYAQDPDLWFKMVHADDRDKVLDQARRLPMGETVPPLEHRILHKNGQIRWVRNTAVIHRDSRNRVEAYDGLISDITERKLAEEQINAHAHKLEIINRVIMAVNKASSPADALDEALRSALELMQFRSGCIYLVNTTTGTADICCANGCKSDFITDMARVDMNDSRYATLIKSGHAAFDGNCRITYPELAEQWDIAAMARLPLISQDKTIGWLLLADSIPHNFTPAERDILLSIARQIGTALAKAESESALRESENRYRTITEQSLVGIQIIKDNQLIFVNEGWTAITGYTRRDLEHWSNRDFLRIIHPDDRQFFMAHIQDAQQAGNGGSRPCDCRFISQSGATKWVALHVRRVNFADGAAIMSIIVDITNRKLAEQALAAANRRLQASEEQLRAINRELSAANAQLKAGERKLMAANRDKEILLKEIHHRVKNNLQVISSLLKLQLAYIRDEQARQLLGECQNRIKSIAIVHEKLYQAPNLAEVNVSEYIQSLTKHLFRALLVDPASVTVKIETDNVVLGVDKAIPCSLLINELVSNSLKYAFSSTRNTGEISIKLLAEPGARYVLEVADTGCGIPEHIDFRNTATLGMQLVMTFVEQLNGAITLDKSRGTRFIISFPDEKRAAAIQPPAQP
jgi:PAS domain S-box-containing protein